jgi:hypothetical protein
MRAAHPLLFVVALASGAAAQTPASAPTLDFDFFKTRGQPISVAQRPHLAYVTPDGRFVVAGSIRAATINVIDAKTEEPAWTLKMDLGIRPMTFSTKVVDIA